MLTRNNATTSVVSPSQQYSLPGFVHRLQTSTPSGLKPMEFKQMGFYFDQIDQITLTKYSAFILKFGGRIVNSIDEKDFNPKTQITHIISERHLSRKEFDDMQRKCILRPRKPSAQEILNNGGNPGEFDCNTLSTQTLPSITSATTTNLSLIRHLIHQFALNQLFQQANKASPLVKLFPIMRFLLQSPQTTIQFHLQ